jgi:GntR family transcriptional regulator/MocR family aminotransferase
MHLSLRLRDPRLSDAALARRAREEGIVVNALSAHAVGEGTPWNGLMLGYAQVPSEQMDELVKRLAAVVHLTAYAGGATAAPGALSPARPDRPANRSPNAASSPSPQRRP